MRSDMHQTEPGWLVYSSKKKTLPLMKPFLEYIQNFYYNVKDSQKYEGALGTL